MNETERNLENVCYIVIIFYTRWQHILKDYIITKYDQMRGQMMVLSKISGKIALQEYLDGP